MMRIIAVLAAALAVAAGAGLAADGAAPATAPASRPAGAATGPAATQPTGVVTVTEVQGQAFKLAPGDAGAEEKWTPLAVGERIDEQTIIRTGFRTRVVLAFADNATVVIDRATKMGVAQFRKAPRSASTHLGLKYGAMRAQIEKARGPSDFTVATPVATLAIPGSGGPLAYCGDIGFNVQCESGTFNVVQGHKRLFMVGQERTNTQLDKSITLKDLAYEPNLGDVSGGLTRREIVYLGQHGGGRGIIGFTPGAAGSGNVIPPGVGLWRNGPDVDVPGMDTGLGD